jgi:hypothetical protein
VFKPSVYTTPQGKEEHESVSSMFISAILEKDLNISKMRIKRGMMQLTPLPWGWR